jgi:hypothetical protein
MSRPKPKRRTRKPGAETDYAIARDELRANGPRARWALDTLEQMARGESTYGTAACARDCVHQGNFGLRRSALGVAVQGR